MLIQDVERRTGLDRATVRFYEKEGLVVPEREENGYRTYTEKDIMTLLRVKLLRQLGVSLTKIKSLQQGSSDFTLILSEQIEILENQIQEDTRAKTVCCEIQSDGAEYADLDADYYLRMLTSAPAITVSAFAEPLKREVHPWRRYIARFLDYRIVIALLQLLFIIILRIRPFTDSGIEFLNYISAFIAVPLLAWMLCSFGTTPGKWLMGIRLESVQGGRLSGGEALNREGKLIYYGMGLMIPILSTWRTYRSYRNEIEGIPQAWNEDTEIIYNDLPAAKKIMAVSLLLITLGISLFAGFDATMPTYRGKGLTIAEFAENYNDYTSIPYVQSSFVLNDEGKWAKTFEESFEPERPEFIYKTDENGYIQSVYFEYSWETSDFQFGLPMYCEDAIDAIVCSQSASNYRDIQKLDKLINDELYGNIMKQGESGEGSFIIRGVRVSWETEIRNCEFVQDKVLFATDDTTMYFHIKLLIEIL